MHQEKLITKSPDFVSPGNIQQLDFSSSWNISALEEIIRDEGLLMHAERGKFFFRQGDVVDKIFLIQSGCVAFTRNDSEGNRQILDFFFSDRIFSDLRENSQPATFSAQCLLDTHAYALSRASLRRIAAVSPEVFQAVNALLLSFLSQAYDNLHNIGCRHGEERVAFALCKIYDGLNAYNGNGSKETEHDIPIRQIDIADAIGMTPVYINQILRSLKKNGGIGINKGTIKINDIKLLKDICSYDEFGSRHSLI